MLQSHSRKGKKNQIKNPFIIEEEPILNKNLETNQLSQNINNQAEINTTGSKGTNEKQEMETNPSLKKNELPVTAPLSAKKRSHHPRIARGSQIGAITLLH